MHMCVCIHTHRDIHVYTYTEDNIIYFMIFWCYHIFFPGPPATDLVAYNYHPSPSPSSSPTNQHHAPTITVTSPASANFATPTHSPSPQFFNAHVTTHIHVQVILLSMYLFY